MKLFLYLFIASVAFLVILFIVSLFLSDKYSLQKSTYIKAPQDTVFYYVSDLRNWNEWSGWKEIHDTTVQFNYSTITSGKNASMTWTGRALGAGKIIVTDYKPKNEMRYNMHLQDNKFVAKGAIFVKDSAGGSVMIWRDSGKLRGPLAKLMYGVFKKDLQKNLQKGLKNVKKKMESRTKI